MFHAPADVPRMGAPVMERAGSSGNAKNGSHPAAADFSNEPGAVHVAASAAPYRIRPSVVRDGLAGQCGAENGPAVYARLISAPGPHAAVTAAQVVI